MAEVSGTEATQHLLPSGASVQLLEDELLIQNEGKPKEDFRLKRKEVYGAAFSGSTVTVHYIAFSQGKKAEIKINPANGLPATGEPWYVTGEWGSASFRAGDEGKARTLMAMVCEWACPRKLDIHVIANPKSGHGKGLKVAKTFEAKGKKTRHSITLHMTTRAGEATSIAANLLLQEDGSSIVAAVGGDGTMCEVIDGLMQRPDAGHGKFTVAYVPAGTANAVANLVGCGDNVVGTWAAFKAESKPIDIFSFRQAEKVRYGVLSLTSGLIADIDIESEVCRCCGPDRFTMYAIMKIFCCCCCCWCSPVHSRLTYKMNISWIPVDAVTEPPSSAAPGAPPPTAPTFPEDHPAWQHWDGDLQFFHVLNSPAIDQNSRVSPQSRLDDGSLNVNWMTPTNRVSLVGQFDKIEAATHLEDAKHWQNHRVRAVRGTHLSGPIDKIVLDGELCRPEPWYAEVIPGYLNVVVGSGPLPAFA